MASNPKLPPKQSGGDNATDKLVEILAEIEHERWSGWMKWVYQNGKWLEDDSFIITPSKANRWFTLTNVQYNDLDEATKEYDRIEVRKTLQAVEKFAAQDIINPDPEVDISSFHKVILKLLGVNYD